MEGYRKREISHPQDHSSDVCSGGGWADADIGSWECKPHRWQESNCLPTGDDSCLLFFLILPYLKNISSANGILLWLFCCFLVPLRSFSVLFWLVYFSEVLHLCSACSVGIFFFHSACFFGKNEKCFFLSYLKDRLRETVRRIERAPICWFISRCP